MKVIDHMSLKQRMYPQPEVAVAMLEHAQHARFLWNIGLEQRAIWSETKRHYAQKINYNSQARELTELRSELDWLCDGSTVVQQGALRDLDQAFKNFFKGTHAYPNFKKRSLRKGGFVVRDLVVRRINKKWGEVSVPKVGYVRFRLSYVWADIQSATSARITLRNGAWHVSFTTPPRGKINPGTGEMVGIDRGVANSVATSDEEFFQAPSLSEGEGKRFLVLARRLARQQKDSRRRGATLNQMATLRRKLDNRRTDWVEQTTTALSRRYDLVAVEALNTRGMVRRPAPQPDPENEGQFLPNGAAAKSGLNKAILASQWGKIAERLSHKTNVEKVNPKNTSRECHECGHISANNRESQAVFECEKCGHMAHADINAAKNILERYLAKTQPEDISGARAYQSRKSRANHLAA